MRTSDEPAILDEWRRGYLALKAMPRHEAFPIAAWRQVIADMDRFGVLWARRSAVLGWSTLDIFGVDADSPYHRVDAAGLVLMLGGDQVADMTESAAFLVHRGRSHELVFRKPRDQPGRVPLWDCPPPTNSTRTYG